MILLLHGDALEELKKLESNSVDSIVTDPPYGISFMNKKWDYNVPSVEVWKECLRVLKPGGYLLSFAGTRTQHRMACNIEDAGFEIRDMIAWIYGSGFPKSLDISKAIDKKAKVNTQSVEDKIKCGLWLKDRRESIGLSVKDISHYFPSKTDRLTGCVSNWENGKLPTWGHFSKLKKILNLDNSFDYLIEDRPKDWIEAEREIVRIQGKSGSKRNSMVGDFKGGECFSSKSATNGAKQWDGWGTALKPALEPITVARKPLSEKTVAQNVLKWGTGGINIDGCRIKAGKEITDRVSKGGNKNKSNSMNEIKEFIYSGNDQGRFPANLIHDGSDEVINLFPKNVGASAPVMGTEKSVASEGNITGKRNRVKGVFHNDSGSAARFFYCSKASKEDRGKGNNHPTVKPTDLMRYLVRLVTPEGGICLDPYMGSGTTGKGCKLENFSFIGIENEKESFDTAKKRIDAELYQTVLF